VLQRNAAYEDKETQLGFSLARRATEFYDVAKVDPSVEHGVDSKKMGLSKRWQRGLDQINSPFTAESPNQAA
jgi:hypothetical protein